MTQFQTQYYCLVAKLHAHCYEAFRMHRIYALLIGVGSKFEVWRPWRGEKNINFAARSAAENFFKVCAFRLSFVKEISLQNFLTVQ